MRDLIGPQDNQLSCQKRVFLPEKMIFLSKHFRVVIPREMALPTMEVLPEAKDDW